MSVRYVDMSDAEYDRYAGLVLLEIVDDPEAWRLFGQAVARAALVARNPPQLGGGT